MDVTKAYFKTFYENDFVPSYSSDFRLNLDSARRKKDMLEKYAAEGKLKPEHKVVFVGNATSSLSVHLLAAHGTKENGGTIDADTERDYNEALESVVGYLTELNNDVEKVSSH